MSDSGEDSLSSGQILKQRYRIQKLLGRGGFGAVYLAWDTSLDGLVALKENLETFPGSGKQFELEAKLLFKLRHPNLPRVTDYFSLALQEGQLERSYAVMDYIEGEDLGSILQRRRGPLPQEQVLDWISQVCEALTYLHAQEPAIIHRDIKPANIRITPRGRAILVDFGIAKVYDPSTRTTAAARAISRGYSPPEQYGLGTTDARSDVYSLGATAYHLLTGEMPPAAMDVTAGLAPAARPARELNAQVSRPVSAAVEKAMQLNRTLRFSSAAEFKAALLQGEQFMAETVVSTRPTSLLASTLVAGVAPTLVAPPPLEVQQLIERWRTAHREPGWTLEGHKGSVECVAYSPDGELLASASVDKSARLWRCADGSLFHILEGHTRSVNGIAFSPDGRRLASGSSDKTIRLWRVSNGSLLRTIKSESGLVTGVAFSPNGQALAYVSGNHTVQLWRLADGSPLRTLEERDAGVTGIAFSPDGTILACESWRDKAIRLWRVVDGFLLRVLKGHSADVTNVAFSPDGTLLASSSWDNTVRLWRLPDGVPLQTLEGHKAGVLSVTFAPGGGILASGSADYSVRLWQLADGSQLRRLKGHTNWVNSVAFSPDGTRLASGSRDGTLRIWGI